ncbi:MAG: SDR family NAD(P)-dependent oxidoreductase [Limosilactobacillus pontis]
MKACYPYLKKTQGSVINFASGAGLFGNYGQCAYAAAKKAFGDEPSGYHRMGQGQCQRQHCLPACLDG